MNNWNSSESTHSLHESVENVNANSLERNRQNNNNSEEINHEIFGVKPKSQLIRFYLAREPLQANFWPKQLDSICSMGKIGNSRKGISQNTRDLLYDKETQVIFAFEKFFSRHAGKYSKLTTKYFHRLNKSGFYSSMEWREPNYWPLIDSDWPKTGP